MIFDVPVPHFSGSQIYCVTDGGVITTVALSTEHRASETGCRYLLSSYWG